MASQEGKRNCFEVEIGAVGKPLEHTITNEEVIRNCWATEDYNPWHMEDSPWGGPITTPTFPVMYQNAAFGQSFFQPAGGGWHTRQHFDFLNPLKVGKKITLTTSIKERYEKRGRYYTVYETTVVDEDGNEIMRMGKHMTPSMYQNPEDKKQKREG
ncbi:MaoC family dehydratase [Chloroflexota bacterium]